MTKPYVLPDEIFARITRSQVRTWVRGEAEIKKTKCATKQARYIRADLVSTPNKPAEVDLPSEKELFLCERKIGGGENDGAPCYYYYVPLDPHNPFIPNKPADIDWVKRRVEQEIKDLFNPTDIHEQDRILGAMVAIDHLHSSGHLATGKGGDDFISLIKKSIKPGECLNIVRTTDNFWETALGTGRIHRSIRNADCAKAVLPQLGVNAEQQKTPQPSPQSDMVAVPREVVEKIAKALFDGADFSNCDTKHKNIEIARYAQTIERQQKEALSMLQPYTKETK